MIYVMGLALCAGLAKEFWAGGHKKSARGAFRCFGAHEWIRTTDLYVTNAVLYRLSYVSDGRE